MAMSLQASFDFTIEALTFITRRSDNYPIAIRSNAAHLTDAGFKFYASLGYTGNLRPENLKDEIVAIEHQMSCKHLAPIGSLARQEIQEYLRLQTRVTQLYKFNEWFSTCFAFIDMAKTE
jgi:hypothetical protein